MKTSRLCATIHLVVGAVLAKDTQHPRGNVPHRSGHDARGEGTTQKYLIEVKQGFSLASVARRAIPELPEKASFYKAFNCSDIFSGIVVESLRGNIDALNSIDGVVSVWPARMLPPPSIVNLPGDSVLAHDLNSSMHRWTGVDKLHAAGVRGKGAKVAIVDTGIDYTHEALGGCLGPGCKVSGGYDLVGHSWNRAKNPPRPDGDPMDDEGHGTHVAGIVAGKSKWLTGVAPEAELLAYKVYDNSEHGGTSEELLIQAFCDAYSSGADVITSSVNMRDGFADGAWALVASRIVDKGVVVTIAAGNEGSFGPFSSGTGSSEPSVLSVAAINVSQQIPKIGTLVEEAQPAAAEFTSWGPTNEFLMKPDIGAPGTDIMSTTPNQDYAPFSGTSMACPYIAGVAALYVGQHGGRQVHGSGFARNLAKRIISSGRSVAWKLGSNGTAPPFQVGTGLVDAQKVLGYITQLSFDSISLGDTESFKPEWTVEIANMGNDTVTYSFELEPQSAFEIADGHEGLKSNLVAETEPLAIVPTVTLPVPQVVLPGHKKAVRLTFSLPKHVNDDMLPLYGGKVWVIGDNGEELCIPYGGAAYDTEKAFDTMFIRIPKISDNKKERTWSFDTENTAADYMEVTTMLGYPCMHLRWDIFESDWIEQEWEYPPRIGKAGYVGSAATYANARQYDAYKPATHNKNHTSPFPTRAPRGLFWAWWFGKLANGTQIAPGNYTMRFAALRPYGNPRLSGHWDIMQTRDRRIEVVPYETESNSKIRRRN